MVKTRKYMMVTVDVITGDEFDPVFFKSDNDHDIMENYHDDIRQRIVDQEHEINVYDVTNYNNPGPNQMEYEDLIVTFVVDENDQVKSYKA